VFLQDRGKLFLCLYRCVALQNIEHQTGMKKLKNDRNPEYTKLCNISFEKLVSISFGMDSIILTVLALTG